MAIFNKETEYALRGLVYIQLQNLEGRIPGVAEIAKEIDAPPSYTAKILQRMVRNDFIASVKGKGGGFFFEENKPELPLKDLIINIEGAGTLTGCGFGLKNCDSENPCPLHNQYATLRESLNTLVSNETIQTLAKKNVRSFMVKENEVI
jgi:Rrf2 family protein